MKQIITFFFLVLSCNIWSQTPKIIVNIHIEGLSSELLSTLKPKLGIGGFNRFLDYGLECTNVHTNTYSSNSASLLALIHSGAYPYLNGITANESFNRIENKKTSCISNSTLIGTSDPNIKNYNAKQLLSTTFGDELYLFSNKKSKIFSVAPNAYQSIIMGGHSATGAYWLDNRSGLWTSANCYIDSIPQWIMRENDLAFSNTYFSEPWNLLKDDSIYTQTTNDSPFPIKLDKFKYSPFKFGQLKHTPFINTLITNFAINLITKEFIDNTPNTHIISLSYNIDDEWMKDQGMLSQAREDLYLRMDEELNTLVAGIEKNIDIKQVLFVLTGSGSIEPTIEELKEAKIPMVRENTDKISALLNSFLIAYYGSGNWILNYSNNQIYLNNKLIIDKKLRYEDVIDKVIELSHDFSSIESSIPIRLLTSKQTPSNRDQLIINSLNQDKAGDIYVILKPGRSLSAINPQIPVYFYGWKSKKSTINTSYNITQLAPTISIITKTPSPSGCEESAMGEVLDNFK